MGDRLRRSTVRENKVRIFADLKQSLVDALRYERGKRICLRTHTVSARFDQKCIRKHVGGSTAAISRRA